MIAYTICTKRSNGMQFVPEEFKFRDIVSFTPRKEPGDRLPKDLRNGWRK